jgi:hypothetical protein
MVFGILAIGTVSTTTQAQSRDELTVNIPFPFTVESRTFPAGEYRVTRLNPQADTAALAIRSADTRLIKVVLTAPIIAIKPFDRAMLVFNRYGEKYFLSQFWAAADNTGRQFAKSRNELILARKPGERAPERTTLAFNSRPR